jgi:hypothetical protein
MSTRCHIIVEDQEWGYNTILYRHSDGYPNGKHGVVATLAEFMQVFMKRRGWDPIYLPAQLLHFMIAKDAAYNLESIAARAKRCGRKPSSYEQEMLACGGNDFLGYGITNDIHGDVEYIYVINKDGVEVYDVPYNAGSDRSKWKRLTTDRQAKRIMEGKVPRKWKEKKEKVA